MKKPSQSIQISNQKVPRFRTAPAGRNVRVGVDPGSFDRESIVWQVNRLDKDGSWGWHPIQGHTLRETVLERMKHFESMTWGDLPRGGSHSIPVANLCKEAQERLQTLKLYEDEIYSLRLSSKERMIGIKEGRVFKILWWDPEHTVCPSEKKHT